MNYVQKYFEEIFESMLNDSLEKGLISHADEFASYIGDQEDISNYYVMDKAVIAQMFQTVYESMTSIYESAKVEYAEGTDLDEIGAIIGIPRPAATKAKVLVSFTIPEAINEDINIPPGVVISTDSGIEYETVDSIFIAEDSYETEVTAQAVVPGVSSKVVENTLTTIVSDVDYDFTVNNASSSSGGSEAYTDDEYRYLLMNWTKIRLKGSFEAYEEYFSNFDGLDSYNIIPCWNGAGTVKIVLDPGYPSQLQQAYDELQSSVVQITEDITLSPPIDKKINIYATVNVDIDQVNPYSLVEKDEIRARIITAIKIFIDGGYLNDGSFYPGLVLGEDFIPHKLAVFLDDEVPELKDINFIYPESYIRILDEEIGKSDSIVIEMI